MQKLSATEAFAPAWERTRIHMFHDFSLRRYMKLASVGFLASLGGSSGNFNSNMRGNHSTMAHSHLSTMAAATTATALVLIGVFVLAIGLTLFYIGSRMQFVLFETVVTDTSLIAPVWNRYGRRTWRWIGLKLLLFLVSFLLALPVLLPIFLTVFKNGHLREGAHALFITYIGAAGLMFLLVIVMTVIYFLLQDFVMPVIALEDASIRTGLGRLKVLLEQDLGGVALYLLLRCIASFVISMALIVAWGIALAISFIPLIIGGCALYFPLHKTGFAGFGVMVLGFVVMGLVGFAWALITLIAVVGWKQTYFQTYAACFYAGRYPQLNDVMDPPVLLAASPEPAAG
jgi:hypothetical protein